MVIIVFFAFFGTCGADIRTQVAYLCNVVAVKAHQSCSGDTYGAAFHIQFNAIAHIRHMFFLQAGCGAMVADSCTLKTGFDTGLIGTVRHKKEILPEDFAKNDASRGMCAYIFPGHDSGTMQCLKMITNI